MKPPKKWVKMEKFTLPAKILHCHRQWQISPLDDDVQSGQADEDGDDDDADGDDDDDDEV